jgi:hypothetical protein
MIELLLYSLILFSLGLVSGFWLSLRWVRDC